MPLKNSEVNALRRDYDRKRFKALRDADARREEVYKALPELKELHDEIVKKNASRARLAIMNKKDDMEKCELEVSALRKNYLSLLTSRFPEDYLEPKYTCPDCKDTGYIGNEQCHCFRQAAIDLLYKNSNIKDILVRENFDTLTMDYYDRTAKDGKRSEYEIRTMQINKCREYVRDFDEKHGNLLFLGSAGCGKTFLSNCIAKALIDTCHSVVYFSAQSLFDLFAKNIYHYDDDETDPIDQYILESDLLIIDDLGTEHTTGYTNSKFFYCINERMLRNKSTIISSNLTPQNLQDIYTERTASRILSSYDVLTFYGEDIRIKKRFSK